MSPKQNLDYHKAKDRQHSWQANFIRANVKYRPVRLSDADCEKLIDLMQRLFNRQIDAWHTRDIADKYGWSMPKTRAIMWELLEAGVYAEDGAVLTWNNNEGDTGFLKHTVYFFD